MLVITFLTVFKFVIFLLIVYYMVAIPALYTKDEILSLIGQKGRGELRQAEPIEKKISLLDDDKSKLDIEKIIANIQTTAMINEKKGFEKPNMMAASEKNGMPEVPGEPKHLPNSVMKPTENENPPLQVEEEIILDDDTLVEGDNKALDDQFQALISYEDATPGKSLDDIDLPEFTELSIDKKAVKKQEVKDVYNNPKNFNEDNFLTEDIEL